MRNIEIKVRLRDRTRATAELAALGAADAGTETQHDVFYRCARGRLKLRESSRDGAALIHYDRADVATQRRSDYEILRVADPPAMRAFLDRSLERTGEVRKERRLFLLDNVRVHLDRVEGLGDFLELEAVVDPAHPEPECHRSCERLLRLFGIEAADRVATAYVDLLADV